jgi:phosphatidylglycerol:prolipoprotein diacylglycerol transferase
MAFAIPFPALDPVAFEIGPITIRWYALAYVAGILIGWRYAVRLAAETPRRPSVRQIDDFVLWATLGVIIGGRLGYVLFYQPHYYLAHPLEILAVWRGGMSFHGGLAGVVVALVAYARHLKLDVLAFSDVIACVAPIGLFFGRLANFVNGELYGRVTDVPWAIVFPDGGNLPRHPSQLYEAGLEGAALFFLLWAARRFTRARTRPGVLTGIFLAGYGAARVFGEMFREPDTQLGFLVSGLTMGQILSLPLIIAGIAFMLWPWLSARLR